MTQFGTPTRSQAGTSSFPPSRPTSPPTLSRRSTGTPSIDPPRSQGRNDEQRRARRAQLRDFYGIDNAGPSSSQANGGSGDDGAVNVDSEGFDAVKYYEDMIGKSSLEELMKRAVALTAVGDLQSSRHSLVYNHHHKLFSAGDAIQVLNTRTPQLISIVTCLQDSFSSISQLADSVALPDLSHQHVSGNTEAVDSGTKDSDGEKALKRLRLMWDADCTPESIQAFFDGIEPHLAKEAEDGDEGAGRLLRECRELLPPREGIAN